MNPEGEVEFNNIVVLTPFGHDGFLIEVEAVGNVLRDALAIGLKGNFSK